MIMTLSVARIRNGEKPMVRIRFAVAGSGRTIVSGIRIFFLRSVQSTNMQELI